MKLPIHFVDSSSRYKVSEHLKNDIYLDELYSILCSPDTQCSNDMMSNLTEYYTTDCSFLLDHQKWLKSIHSNTTNELKQNTDIWFNEWTDLQSISLEDFQTKYHYIHWSYADYLNEIKPFITAYSYYLILSPLSTLIIPILFFIIPFIIIKFISRETFTWNTYKTILTAHFLKHIFGTQSTMAYECMKGSRDWNTISYVCITFSFYLFNFYKSIMNCIDYYRQTYKITTFFTQLKHITKYSMDTLEQSYKCIKKPISKSWRDYKTYLIHTYNEWKEFYNLYLEHHNDFSIHTLRNIGVLMYDYYIFFTTPKIHEILNDIWEWNGYYQLWCQLNTHLCKKLLNPCKFNKHKKHKLKDLYYPSLIHSSLIVKNNVIFDKRGHILTGVNASGKTTLLKSVLFSTLTSQQFGIGCYNSKTNISHIYTQFFSYINIPDTNDRNSLFQSESKRCKTIIDNVSKDKYSLCVFDELFSGTNPIEATNTSIAYIHYLLNNYPFMNIILTTHYHDVCHRISKKHVKCLQMKSHMNKEKTNITMTYNMKSGICDVFGGLFILKQINFPNEIIQHTKKLIKSHENYEI